MKLKSLFAVSFLFRLLFYIYLFDTQAWNTQMAFRFDERALQIIQNESVLNLAAWGSYPLLIAPIYKILDLLGLLSIRISVMFWLNQFFGLATAYFCFQILKQLNVKNKWSYLAVGCLILFNPLQIYMNSQNISESLFQLLTVLSFAVYFGAIPLSKINKALVLGLLLSLALMCRNIILPFLLFLPVYLYGIRKSLPSWLTLKNFLLGTIAGFVLITAVGQINSIFDRHHYKSLSLNRGANIAQAWCEAPTIEYKSEQNSLWFHPPAYWSLEKTRSLMTDVDFDESHFYLKAALNCLKNDPELILFRFRSILQIISGPLYPDPLRNNGALFKTLFSAMAGFALILTLLFLKSFLQDKRTQILLVFIIALLAGVYFGNPGEARFMYSMVQILAILIACILNTEQYKRILAFSSVSLVLTFACFKMPSLADAIRKRDFARFQELSSTQKISYIQEKQKSLSQTKSMAQLCPQENRKTETCLKLDANACSAAEKQRILQLFETTPQTAITERDFFCRNYFLLQLREVTQIDIPSRIIQSPSPLPGGPGHLSHSLIGVAAQLLQVDLLMQKTPELVAQDESYDQLLFSLLSFQFRQEFNRAEYKNKVVMHRSLYETSQEAENYYLFALQSAEARFKTNK